MSKKQKPSRQSPFQRLREQSNISHARQTDPALIQQVLTRVQVVNERSGFLAWDLQRIAEDPLSDPGPAYPRLRPLAPGSARLFISYSWSRDNVHNAFDSDLWVDAFAGFLFNRGYDIVFDRDPRNFDKGLN